MRIPVYQQGKGVRKPTTQLGLKADAQAFVGSNLQTVDFFKTAEKAQFDFIMAEKDAETKAVYTKIKNEYVDEVNEFQRNDKSTTTTEYQGNFNNFNKKFDLRYGKYNLTANQTRDIKQKMSLLVTNAQQTGKQSAFNRGRDEASKLNNSIIRNYVTEISKLPLDHPLRNEMIKEAELEIQYAQNNGETKHLDISTKDKLTQEILTNDTMMLVDTTTSLDSLDSLRETTLQSEKILSSEKSSILAKIDAKTKTVFNQVASDVVNAIITADLGAETNKSIQSAIATIKGNEDLKIKSTKDGKVVDINFGKIPTKYKDAFILKIETEWGKAQDKEYANVYNTLKTDIQSKDLSTLKKELKLIETNKLYKQFIDVNKRNGLARLIQDEINERAPKAVANAREVVANIEAKVTVKGVVDEDDESNFADAHNKLLLAERYDQASKLKTEFNALKVGANVFNQIQFLSAEETAKARLELARELKENPNVVTKKQLEIFDNLVKKREAELKTDPVSYYLTNSNLKPEDVTTEKLIEFQRNLKVPEFEIRLHTNQELESFKNTYEGAQTYSDKANALNSFVVSKGINNEKRVLRHLVESGTIALRDNFLAAFGTNARTKSVYIANADENIKRYKTSVTLENRNEVSNETNELFGDYSNSFLGVGADDVLGGGFTKGRASFILGMRDLVTNTANFYLDSGQEKDPIVAANRAFEDVVGSNYNLNNTINDGVVRFDKSILEETATNVTEILSVSLLNNVDYLKTVVVPPPAPFGLDEAGIQQHNENYYEELAEKGTWRTTNDNQGVYLVDQLGNIVQRKDSITEPGVSEQPFVSVKFSKVGEYLEKYNEIKSNEANINQRKINLRNHFIQVGQLF